MNIDIQGQNTQKNNFNRVDILKSVNIFQDADTKVLNELSEKLKEIHIDKDGVVFSKGDMLNAMYIIVFGNVIVHDGEHVFTNFGTNDFFGEYSLIDSSVRSATVTATEPTLLLRLDQEDFNEFIDSHPEVSRSVLKALIRRLRNNNILEERLTKNSIKIKKQRDELAKQSKELMELNATKDKFFTIIAHDLKNPFNTVIGLSELLVSRYDQYNKDKIQSFVNQIHKFSTSAYDLLENLLNWSRSQTGRIAVRPIRCNLYDIIEDAINISEVRIHEKRLVVQNSIDKELVCFADDNLLKTVVRNLLSNAIKFTNISGFIRFFVEEKNSMAELTIEDNGVGIPDHVKDELFEIHSTYTTNGTHSETGTGLGLIIVKEFVEKNGGTISVKSKEGKGTKFIFTIPLLKN